MKKQFLAQRKRMNMLGAALFGMILFLVAAPFSLFSAGALALAYQAVPHINLPAGILGTGTPGGGSEAAEEKALLEKIKQQIDERFNEAVKNNGDFKTLMALATELKEAKTVEELNKIKSQVEEVALSLKSMKEQAAKQSRTQIKTFSDALVESVVSILTKEGNLEEIRDKKRTITGNFKAATTMTTANITPASGSIAYSLVDFIPTPVATPRRNPFVIQLLNVMRTMKENIYWVEMRNADGGAGGTAQATAKTQQDFDLVENSAKVIKYTSYITVSKEMLDDVSYVEGMIRGQLVELVMLKLDNEALLGTGTTTSMNGIQNQATAWSAGSFAASVSYANYFDVLKVGINQINTAVVDTTGTPSVSAGFTANLILMNPTDVTTMLVAKDTQGRYIRDLLTYPTSNTIEIDGVRIVQSTGVVAGTFYIMDSTKINFAMREDAIVSVGWINDNFTNNLVTILCETRGCVWIPTNYQKAVVYGSSFTTAVASLRNSNS